MPRLLLSDLEEIKPARLLLSDLEDEDIVSGIISRLRPSYETSVGEEIEYPEPAPSFEPKKEITLEEAEKFRAETPPVDIEDVKLTRTPYGFTEEFDIPATREEQERVKDVAAEKLKPFTRERMLISDLPPEPEKFTERVKASWEQGVHNVSIGELRAQQLFEGVDTESEIQRLKKERPQYERKRRSLPEEAVRAAAEMAPLMFESLKQATQKGLITAGGFAGVAAVAGQAGPQIATPEELITVPAAAAMGYGVGAVYGASNYIMRAEAGLAYDEMLESKIDPDIARPIAMGVGAVNAVLELAQINTLLKTIPGGKKLLLGNLMKEASKKIAKSPTIKRVLLRAGVKYGGVIATETVQEISQEISSITGAELGKYINNSLRGTKLPFSTKKQIADRLIETAKQSALAFSVMALPGQVVTVSNEIIGEQIQKSGQILSEDIQAILKEEAGFARIRKEPVSLETEAKKEAPLFKPGQFDEIKLLEFNKMIKGEGFTAVPASAEMKKFIRNLPENIRKREAIKLFEKIEKQLAKPLAPAKVARVVEKVTGVTKPTPKVTIKEEVLLKERLRAEVRGAKFGLLEGRRQVQEITKKEDISLAERREGAEFFIKQNLELKDRGKFITAMRDVKTDKDLVKIVLRADLISSATERRHTLDSLKKEIKRTQPALVKGRLKKGKQTISVQAQDRLRDIIDNLTSFKPGGKKQQAIEMAAKFFSENPGEAMPLDLKSKIADLSKSNISEMSTAEIRQLTKDIKSIREQGRTELEATEMKRQEQFQIKKEQLYKSIKQHSLKGKELEKPIPEKPTPLERKKGRIRKILDSLNKATAELKIPAFITEALDGYKMLGPAHRAITAPIDKATANKESFLNKANKRIAQILTPLGKKATKYLNEEFTIQGRKFTKENLWAIYANSKNEANRATLTEDWGYGFSEKLVDEAIDMLPAGDKRMIDKVMSFINEFYPETVRVTQEYSGFTPKTVENYWPIISDRELSDRALMRDVEKDLLADATKKTSMDLDSVKQRVGHSGPPDLNFFRVLKTHINSTAHFNTHALEVRNVQEVINDIAIKRSIVNSAGEGGYNALKSSLSAVANPRRTPMNWFEVKAGQLKKNATAVMLGLKVSVSLLQSGSFFQTINKVGLKDSLAGLYGYWKNPRAAHRFVYGQSAIQENRKQSFDRELRELIEKDSSLKRFLTGKPGGNNLLYEMIHAVDYITVMPTWLAGYKHGVRLHVSDPVAYADDVVRKTQPTGRTKDLAGIMRGSEFQKWFTMFYTFFSSAYNNMALEGGKLRYRMVKEKGIGTKTLAVADFAKAYIWLLVMPALYAAIVRKPKRWRDKEYLAKSVASYALGTVPFVRDVGNVWINPQYEFTGSPVLEAGKAAKMLVSGKKLKTKIKSGVMLGGFATGFPSSQAIITTSGAIDLWEDNTDNPLRLFLSEWSLKGEKETFLPTKSEFKKGRTKRKRVLLSDID